ncbi:hypothetical protein MYU51_007803 [Penicillium brevicompactum]
MANFAASEELTLDFIPNDLVGTTEPTHESFENAEERFYTPEFGSDAQDVHVDQRPENAISQPGHEPVSNPLALLADASGALEPLEPTPVSFITSSSFHDVPSTTSRPTSASNRPSLSREVLHRPGYVSLGLTLNKTTLEAGIDALIHNAECPETYSNYFKTPSQLPRRDIGPDVDPVDLGLVTMDEANFLFPIYFNRLHPVNGILDPMLHTPRFVRPRSALLFTWILALTAQFDHVSASLAKRLRLHGEKLSRHVHTSGFKSVEIVQGYYISLLSANPAETLAEERTWLYTMYAVGLAAELGLDQNSRGKDGPLNSTHPSDDCTYDGRVARNRERTWLRILLWERANSAACGKTPVFPETNLTKRIDSWWLHPLADPTDKHTCAFISLRRILASLQNDLRNRAPSHHADSHWVREMVDKALRPWCELWMSHTSHNLMNSPSERLSGIFLRYVYLHGKLWTLSFALHGSINRDQHLDAIRTDCFEAAINACEIAVRDLDTIGEPLYCMLAPTWAMIAYAAVLALKLFPALYGHRPGSDVELLALLSQVAIQLKRAGTTPSHRFGIAALLGQHLMVILRSKAVGLASPIDSSQVTSNTGYADTRFDGGTESFSQRSPFAETHASLISDYDPFLTTAALSTEGSLTGEGFAEFFRETFGPGFGGVF